MSEEPVSLPPMTAFQHPQMQKHRSDDYRHNQLLAHQQMPLRHPPPQQMKAYRPQQQQLQQHHHQQQQQLHSQHQQHPHQLQQQQQQPQRLVGMDYIERIKEEYLYLCTSRDRLAREKDEYERQYIKVYSGLFK